MNLYLPGQAGRRAAHGRVDRQGHRRTEERGDASTGGVNGKREVRACAAARTKFRFKPDASYVHMCTNNTIEGTQWQEPPDTGDVPLVADMSSDIASRPVDVRQFGLIFAGAQKNLGPSGVTVVIVRSDLAERADQKLAQILQYRTLSRKNRSTTRLRRWRFMHLGWCSNGSRLRAE